MFNPEILGHLARASRGTMMKLGEVEKTLNERFTGLEEAVRALILSVAGGEPLLLIGPPGTAKSRLIRAFCELMGFLEESDSNGRDYFEYLLTPFTEPGELFGYYDISKATKGSLERMDKGMMQHARVVYLDEVFNGSSAILNSILAFMNERIFHDRGERKPVALQCLFAATNRTPETPCSERFFDRFLLRCKVANVRARPQKIGLLLSKGWQETYSGESRNAPYKGLLDEVEAFRSMIGKYTQSGKLTPRTDHPMLGRIAQMVHHSRQYDLSEMSNRRLVKLLYIMLINRLYEAALGDAPEKEISLGNREIQLLHRYFLDRVDEEAVRKMERAPHSLK